MAYSYAVPIFSSFAEVLVMYSAVNRLTATIDSEPQTSSLGFSGVFSLLCMMLFS